MRPYGVQPPRSGSACPHSPAPFHTPPRRIAERKTGQRGINASVQRTSGYPQVNMAWMWGALLAATMAAWLHQLTATALGEDIVHGHGVRGGKAMIATLRWRLIAVPGRLTRHARHLTLRLPPGHGLLAQVLAPRRALPAPARPAPPEPRPPAPIP